MTTEASAPAEAGKPEIAAATMRGDLRDLILAEMRALPRPVGALSEAEQRDLNARVDRLAFDSIKRCGELLMGCGLKKPLEAHVKTFKGDEEVITLTLTLPDTDEAMIALVRGRHSPVYLGGLQLGAVQGQRAPARVDADQPELPVAEAGAAAPEADGEGEAPVREAVETLGPAGDGGEAAPEPWHRRRDDATGLPMGRLYDALGFFDGGKGGRRTEAAAESAELCGPAAFAALREAGLLWRSGAMFELSAQGKARLAALREQGRAGAVAATGAVETEIPAEEETAGAASRETTIAPEVAAGVGKARGRRRAGAPPAAA